MTATTTEDTINTYRIVSESRGLLLTIDTTEADATYLAVGAAWNTGRTVYLQEGNAP